MADLGIEVELKPVMNEGEFNSKIEALKKLSKLPVTVNAGQLRDSINKALDGQGIHKLKLDINQPYLSKQIKTAIQTATGGILETGKSKSSSGSSKAASAAMPKVNTAEAAKAAKATAAKLAKNATDPLDKVSNYLDSIGDAASSGIKNSARVVRGINKQIKYLESLKSPLDNKAISKARAGYDEIGKLAIGSDKWFNKIIETQQYTNQAISKNSVRQYQKMQNESKKIASMAPFLKREKQQYRAAGERLPADISKLLSDRRKYYKMDGYDDKKQALGKSILSQYSAIQNKTKKLEAQAAAANSRLSVLKERKTSKGTYADSASLNDAEAAVERLNKTTKRSIQYKQALADANEKLTKAEKLNTAQQVKSLQKSEDENAAARKNMGYMRRTLNQERKQYRKAGVALPDDSRQLSSDINKYFKGEGTAEQQAALRKSVEKQWAAHQKKRETEKNSVADILSRADALSEAKTKRGFYPDEKSIKEARRTAEVLRNTTSSSSEALKARLEAEKAVNDAEEKNSRVKVARLQEIEDAYNNNKGANDYIKNRKELMDLENRLEKVRSGDVVNKRALTSADEVLDKLRNTSRGNYSYDALADEARKAVDNAEKKNSQAEIDRIEKLNIRHAEMTKQLDALEAAKATNVNRDSDSIVAARQELDVLSRLSPASSEYADQIDRTSKAVSSAVKLNGEMSDSQRKAYKTMTDHQSKLSDLDFRNSYLRKGQVVDKGSLLAAEKETEALRNMRASDVYSKSDAYLTQRRKAIEAVEAAEKNNSKSEIERIDQMKTKREEMIGQLDELDAAKSRNINRDAESISYARQEIDALSKLSPASKEYKQQFDSALAATQAAVKANSTDSGLSDRAKDYAQAKKQASEYAKTLSYLRTQELADKKSVTSAENALEQYMGMGMSANGRDAKLREVGDLVSTAKSNNTVKMLEKQKAAEQEILRVREEIATTKSGLLTDSSSLENAEKELATLEKMSKFGAEFDKQLRATQVASGRAARLNDTESITKAQNEITQMANSLEVLRARGSFTDSDLGNFNGLVDQFKNAAAGTKEFENALISAREEYSKLMQQQNMASAENTLRKQTQREQEHLANVYRQASETLRNNPKARGSYLQGELQSIMDRARNPGETDSVEGLQRDLAAVRSSMEELGMTSETLGQRLVHLFKDHFNTAIAMAGLHLLQNSLRQTLQNVIDVDTAMTDLKKVSEGSSQDYANYLDSAGERAKNLGASITDVIGATSEFSRLGFNLEDASNLGDWATKYMNVSEYTNIEDAAQSLVSTLQGFHLAADDVGSIVDRFNEVGNSYAVSSQGLGEALQRSAAALYAGGNSLDESIGLVTAANEVVQDPDTVGTWAKTLSMYLRAAKEDAEAAGVETDGMASSVSNLRDTIKSLTHDKVDIMSDEAGTQFKSTTQIMREIAGVYDQLSDVDQAALLEKLSGKRLANTTAALIQNWSTVEDVIKSTQNATGSADAENAKYLDSIQGKLAQFQAQFQSTSTSVLDSGFVKGTINAGTGILGFFNTLIDKLGVLPGLLAPVASLLLSMNGKSIIGGKGEFGENIFDGSGLFSWLKNYNTKNRDYWKEQNAILKSYAQMKQKLRGADFENALSGASIQSREFAKSLDTVGNECDVVCGQIDKFTAKQEKIGTLGSKIISTFKGIGSAIASMAVSMVAAMAIKAAITEIATTIDKAIMSGKEASEITETVLSNYSNVTSEIDNNLSSVDNMRDRFEELSKGVSSSGENISLTAEQLQEYNDIVSQLVAINPALVQGYNDENQAIIDKNNSIERTIELLKQQRVEEAKNAVYGGTSDNDGGLNNAQAAYVAFQEEYKNARAGAKEVDKKAANLFTKIYSAAKDENDKNANKVMAIIQKATGESYDDFVKAGENNGTLGISGRFSSTGWRKEYFESNAAAIKKNLADIVAQLSDAGLLSNELAAEANNVAQGWNVAGNTIESTTDTVSQMIDTAFQANEKYYDMTPEQQQFLSTLANSLDASKLNATGVKNAATDYAEAMMKVAKYNDNAKKSMEDYSDLIKNRGSMTVSEYQEKAQRAMMSIKGTLRSELSKEELDAIDFRKMFGLEDLQKQTDDLRATITDNLSDVKIADPSKMEEVVGLYQNWVDLHKEMAQLGVTSEELNKATFGNLDLNDRSSVQWTKESLEKYKSEFLSWASDKEKKKWENDTKAMGQYWQNFVNDMDGSVSTVLGSWGTFGKDEIPIAFTPLLDANGTLTPLSSDEVNSYINAIVGRAASMPGELADNILKLDKAQYGIIADIGDTAEHTAEIMHFAGSDGALAQISSAIQEFCETNGYSTGEFFNAIQSGSEDAIKALASMTMAAQDFNLDNLTGDQISTFNKIIANSGDNISEYLGKLQAIDQAGHLGEFLDEFNKKLQAQSGAVRTVAQDLTDYQNALEKSTDNVETHENMVSIYDEFAKSVKKGQINTDAARAQMELLIGKVVDLKEAKKWISENQGFFLTGKDEDKVGQDLTGGFNTLHKKYNALSKDQKALVDGMMQVDWKNGSISVAANDVVDLARAFGMSTASLQQFFDLVDSYSNPAETNISTVSDTVDQLNQATIDAGKNIEPSLRGSKAAWDSLTVAEKQALEAVTKNTGIDPTQMTYNDIERLTNSYNALNAAMGKDFSTANVEKFFSGIGESVVSVEKLSDGTQSIDVKNVSAFVDKVKELSGLNISEGDLPTILNLLNTKTRENGDPYKFTINGEAPITEEDTTQQMMDDLTEVFEHKYNLNIDTTEAEAKIDALIEKCKSFADGSYRTGTTDASSKSGVIKYSEPIGPEYQPKPIVFKTDTTQLDQAKQNLQELQEAGILDPEIDINVVTHLDENAQKFLAGQKLVDNSQSVEINATTHMDSPMQAIINGTLPTNIPVAVNASTNADQETQSLLNGSKQVGVQVSANVDTPNDPVTPVAQEMGKSLDSAINKPRVVNVNTSTAFSNVNSLARLMNSVKSKTVTITVNKKTYETTTTGNSDPGKNKYTGGYTGFTGNMTGMASGGQSIGGKTLVGELGPEQWISRDGKHSKIVGKHGMEVIDTKRGDAIVPANITAGLIRGGLKQSYDGASSSDALANLAYGTGGKYYNWKGPSSKTKIQKVNVTADTSKLEDSVKEALDKIKEEVEDIIDQLEHKIYLVEEQHGDPMQIVAYYEQIQEEAHKAAERFRAQGQKDSSEYVRNMQKQWKQLPPTFVKSVECVFITPKSIELLENPKAI